MPTQPCVMRPRRSTSVISTKTSPAPEFASIPRCVICQSPMTPSVAEYWHIGATLMRLASSRPLILYGENSALVMSDDARWKECGRRSEYRGRWRRGKRASRQPGDGRREGWRTRDEPIHHHEFLRRVPLAADRADRTDRRRAHPGREAGVGATAGELAFHLERKIVRAGRIMIEQFLVLGQ